jgi:hypothetical protein
MERAKEQSVKSFMAVADWILSEMYGGAIGVESLIEESGCI